MSQSMFLSIAKNSIDSQWEKLTLSEKRHRTVAREKFWEDKYIRANFSLLEKK